MKLRNMKDINPEKIAKLEAHMWKAYYRHNFFNLFLLLLELAKEQFHIGYFYALKISYPSALAAVSFRKNRGKESKDLIVKYLTKFYKSINDISIEKFDYNKAAEGEFDWWMIDRYSDDKEKRRQALRESMAVIYNVPSENLTEYGEFRAQAMELQDDAEKEGKEAEWDKAESLLLVSYTSLRKVINN